MAHVQELGKIRRLLVDNLGQPCGVVGKHGQLLGRDMPDARVRHTELYGPPRQNTAVFADRKDVLQPIAAGLLGGVTAFRQFCVSTLFPLCASEWRRKTIERAAHDLLQTVDAATARRTRSLGPAVSSATGVI